MIAAHGGEGLPVGGERQGVEPTVAESDRTEPHLDAGRERVAVSVRGRSGFTGGSGNVCWLEGCTAASG